MSIAASRKNGRWLRIESLEDRSLMSAVPTSIDLTSLIKNLTVNESGDIVIPVHAQVGSTALETVLGIEETFDTIQEIVNGYLNSVPGWHLTGGFDTSPSYSGVIDGTIVIDTTGVLESASLAITCSADIGGAVEGYYGVSVLHVGVGAAADISANVSATASYSMDTNTWYFGGSASVDGYVKGYGSATAWPLKGELYIKGEMEAEAAINSTSGLATANIMVSASVGATAQMKSLFGGWKTIASTSKTLGSWQCGVSYDVGSLMKAETGNVLKALQNVVTTTIATVVHTLQPTSTSVATGVDSSSATSASVATSSAVASTSTSPTVASLNTFSTSGSSSSTAGSVHAAALEQVLESLDSIWSAAA